MQKLSSLILSTSAALVVLSLSPLAQARQYAPNDQAYRVELNKTQILRLPTSAGAVVIGNPAIADISVHAADTLFVVGRGYGETNLIILDRQGQTIMNADIQVTQTASPQNVHLFNGGDRQSYNCTPTCQPAPVLGDSPAFINDFITGERPITTSVALGAQGVGGGRALGGTSLPTAQQEEDAQTSRNGPSSRRIEF